MAKRSGQDLGAPKLSESERFAASAEFAGKPDCLRPDALKHNGARIGQVQLGGVAAAPFRLQAKLKGKCL